MTDVSVLVRSKNEARYLAHVLEAIRAQTIDQQLEIIVIDNESVDESKAIANRIADLVLDCRDYRPGKALNQGLAAASGDRAVVLSAHAIPANRTWLQTLLAAGDGVANHLGTYGGQLYQIGAQFLDKRDLDIFSDPYRRLEQRDSDFWNANSTFAVADWRALPFDEQVIELEDHHWTKRHFARAQRSVVFEPAALVYHYGHENRNDRQFLAPSLLSAPQRVEEAMACLADRPDSWPDVMDAGMTIGSLWRDAAAHRAVPLLAAYVSQHWDFDVRWRMAGALGRIDSPASVPPLIAGVSDLDLPQGAGHRLMRPWGTVAGRSGR